MKKAIIAVVAGLVAFVAGLAGSYFAMPSIAPSVVETALLSADSLAATPPPDSLALALPDSLLADTSALGASTQQALVAALRDSLAEARQHVQRMEDERSALLERLDATRRGQATATKSPVAQGTIEALSTTLAKLEDKELAAILQQLDLNVLEMLYARASARTRPRLLRALPPDAAARFVRRLTGAPPPPDTTTAPTSIDAASD